MTSSIPSFCTSVSSMTTDGLPVAGRRRQKLNCDNQLWYDVTVTSKQLHLDVIVLHSRRGLCIFKEQEWWLDIIKKASRGMWHAIPLNGSFEVCRTDLYPLIKLSPHYRLWNVAFACPAEHMFGNGLPVV